MKTTKNFKKVTSSGFSIRPQIEFYENNIFKILFYKHIDIYIYLLEQFFKCPKQIPSSMCVYVCIWTKMRPQLLSFPEKHSLPSPRRSPVQNTTQSSKNIVFSRSNKRSFFCSKSSLRFVNTLLFPHQYIQQFYFSFGDGERFKVDIYYSIPGRLLGKK